jgi:phage gpG-like protein
MAAFTILVQDEAVKSALNRLADAAVNLTPVLQALGEQMARDTKLRFDSSSGPDGKPWAPNTEATLARYLAKSSGNYKKSGGLSAKGAARLANKKPLIGSTPRPLSTTIHNNVSGNTLVIGSPMPYAAMQQFGGLKSQFPWLWGNIPARPFLPVTQDGKLYPAEQARIVAMLQSFLSQAVGPASAGQ